MEIIRAKKPHLSMDLAPLIDVVFQLLVFFMLTSSFANPAIKLDLPQAQSSTDIPEKNIMISIDSQGRIFLNDHLTSMESLKNNLQILLREANKKSINIKGDRDMSYGYFVQVMDLARQAGATQINIVHQKKSDDF